MDLPRSALWIQGLKYGCGAYETKRAPLTEAGEGPGSGLQTFAVLQLQAKLDDLDLKLQTGGSTALIVACPHVCGTVTVT
jgi:hypothetical protein